jgi:uncharacterized protein YgbK (DUF1537 family)
MIGVVADDLTGANDIGGMFAGAGLETFVFTSTSAARAALGDGPRPDVAIIDTASRYDAPETAYARAAEAFAVLRDAGATRYFKKTCSVFRGNVGREFDAMLDTLGVDFAVVVAGYPSNRRTMTHGVLYADGVPLSESHFRNDPFHPTTESNLVEVLRGETRRAVGLVDVETVARGVEAVRAEMERRKKDRTCLLLFDVPDEAALGVIAEAVVDERVFGGSAGLAGAIAPLWNTDAAPCGLPPRPAVAGVGIPVVAGSLTPRTAAQIAVLAEAGAAVVELNAAAVFDPEAREAEVSRLVAEAAGFLLEGRNVAVMSPGGADRRAGARAAAQARGVSGVDIGRHISEALGEVAARVAETTGQDRLILAGGETASAACAHLGISGLRIGEAVEPGIPVCEPLGRKPIRLLLKGGSMGADNLLARGIERLRRG